MPVYSMTGFATAQCTLGDQTLSLDLRSVNSRFLDLGFKLSDEIRSQEPLLREQLQKRLKRGKVELRANLTSHAAADLPVPDAAWLAQLGQLQAQIQAALPSSRALSVSDILRWSQGSANGAAGLDWPAHSAALKATLTRLIDQFTAARAAEGQRLAQLLQSHIAQLRALAAQAAPLVPQLVQEQQAKFLQRFEDALQQANDTGRPVNALAAQDRALQEAAAFAIRIDVAEELGRLNAHLDELDALLTQGGELGKRLEFLIQELHREANTLGSKSALLDLTRISVDMKVLIEQMREQVQNIE